MKKLYLIILLCLSACTMESVEQKKAENLVKVKLQDFNDNLSKLEIMQFKSFHAIYTTYEDDINYDRYKAFPAKLDSLKKNYRPSVRSWVIYVKFKGYDEYGKFGIHLYQCAIDSKLSKATVLIEVDGAQI